MVVSHNYSVRKVVYVEMWAPVSFSYRAVQVLCDRRPPVNLEGKVFRDVVSPALLYGAETWAITRGQEARLEQMR